MRLEAIGDLVGDYDCYVMRVGKVAEERAELGDLRAAASERLGGFASFGEFGAVVGCYAVDYYEADVVALDCHGELVAEDVVLRFEVVDACALDSGEGWF